MLLGIQRPFLPKCAYHVTWQKVMLAYFLKYFVELNKNAERFQSFLDDEEELHDILQLQHLKAVSSRKKI